MRALALRAPVPVVRTLATVLELAGKVTGTRPLMDRNMVDEFAGRYGFSHSTKAARELGYTWRPAQEVCVGRSRRSSRPASCPRARSVGPRFTRRCSASTTAGG